MSEDKKSCCSLNIELDRRQFLTAMSATVSSIALSGCSSSMIMAGPFDEATVDPFPLDKRLSAEWINALYDRGVPTVYSNWAEQQFIGMPVGGIGGGSVYLGGDGKLWCWDIFNEFQQGAIPYRPGIETPGLVGIGGGKLSPTSGLNYVVPSAQEAPWEFNQGFAIAIYGDGDPVVRKFDRTGFKNIRFTGEYPVGEVSYEDPDAPVQVVLKAFSPFIPLDTDRSSYPATIMRYSVTNTSKATVKVDVCGWCDNPALDNENQHRTDARKMNRVVSSINSAVTVSMNCEAKKGVDTSTYEPLEKLSDYGSLCLTCLDPDGYASAGRFDPGYKPEPRKQAQSSPFAPSIGGVASELNLEPGESRDVTFILAWHFPNVQLENVSYTRAAGSGGDAPQKAVDIAASERWYASKFDNATEVAREIADNIDTLVGATTLWRETWYDSTLPNWLLERTMIPTNALQTNTSFRFKDGRFWAWEGVGCCAGTCTHVWHYAQSVGRLFPDLERDLRERTDYGIALQDNGAIHFRAEYNDWDATDGQAGVILRTLREHQMSADSAFLERIWPKVKSAMDFLITQDARDGEPDGIPVGEQHNTLDAEWFGKVPVLASLYIAALKASVEMADAMGDTDYAKKCGKILVKGQANIVKLFDAEAGYFIQEEDPAHPDAIGVGRGCYIDQVMGQWWGHQLGLGELYDGDKIRSSLSALWDYNFCPDVGILRDSIDNPRLRGRPYALAGDAGLVMCTWPKGGRQGDWESHWQYGYFNECMTGFEYEVAGHMIWESDKQSDLLEKGLAITRAIHDRYDGKLRNPFNEVECSDHYARAMASYGVFLACCGYEYDGPKQHIGFKPRMTQNGNFRAAFTAAEGWGALEQTISDGGFSASIAVKHGAVSIKTIALRTPDDLGERSVGLTQSSHGEATLSQNGKDLVVTLQKPIRLSAGETLSFSFT